MNSIVLQNQILDMMENKKIHISLLGNTFDVKIKDLDFFYDVLYDIKSMPDISEDDIAIIDSFIIIAKDAQNSLIKLKSAHNAIVNCNIDPALMALNSIKPIESKPILWKTYVFKDMDSDFIKIGKSKEPHKRLKTLSLSSGRRLSQIFLFDGDIEYHMHNVFSEFRKNGEWFEISSRTFYEKVENLREQLQHNLFLE